MCIRDRLWDVLPEGKKIGGAPANFAYHVSQFGFDSRVVSAIGDANLGNEILENFDGKNLKYQIEKVPDLSLIHISLYITCGARPFLSIFFSLLHWRSSLPAFVFRNPVKARCV